MSKARTALEEMGKDGSFKRKDSAWRSWISNEEGAEFPPESGRYHLFVAAACPWAQRTLLTRALKGLEDAISTTVVHPTWRRTRPDDDEDKHCGWVFGAPKGSDETFKNSIGLGGPFPCHMDGCEPNPLFESKAVRDIYEKAKDTEGKYTVPILWDKKKETIVSNESAEIIQMLNGCFNEFAKNPKLDLEPEELKEEMASVDTWIYNTLNNGVYRCGFASSQKAYETAITELTDSFDRVAQILEKQRFIAGDQITLSDIRLFPTLLRFDEVYIVYFKCNTRAVRHTPAILNYCREIYQMAGVKGTVDMAQIKMHYYTSHPHLNKFSIIPRGPNFAKLLEAPHDRNLVANSKKQKVEE
ncbi:S-transferase omega-like 2 [Seminavis robusta]|uniref:S-transferase omega-like 2 n=1 Tax=Seminavis robusta TaxID=568900 RepID=A0A9N8EFJ6_9STRA|nr:S-transferase omega-like 2 [Seminavis robusta]|eukprot:Sro1006_g230310.1 S-transferase omega-like 2 (357) ;mRNA; r:8383-9561